MRLNRQQQREILALMLEEARQRTAQGLAIREVVQHVRQVRDDAKSAMRQGLTIHPASQGAAPGGNVTPGQLIGRGTNESKTS